MTSAAEDAPYIPAPSFHAPSFHISKRSLIIVLVVAIIAAGVGLWFGVIRTKPTDIVKGYLAALARADSAAALGYGCNPASGPYLTDAVLARSQQLAPLSVKSVRSAKGPSGRTSDGFDVTAVFADVTMGDDDQSLTFRIVNKPGHLCLLVTYVTVDVNVNAVSIDPVHSGPVPLASVTALLNGAAVEGSRMHLFPGTYELTMPNALVVMTNNIFTVTQTSPYSDPDLEPVKIEVTPNFELADGVPQRLTTLITDDLNKCLKETTTRTSCGFGTKEQGDFSGFWPVGEMDPSSLRWAIGPTSGSSLPKSITWWLVLLGSDDYAFAARYTADPGFIGLTLSAERKSDGYRLYEAFLVTPVVILSDPNNLRVEWWQ